MGTSPNEASDITLVYLAKAGHDDRAFAELVRRHQARLRAFLMRLSGNNFDVDDLAQISLMKALRAIHSFEGGCSFRSWLFAIAYREYLQAKRKEEAKGNLIDALQKELASKSTADVTQDLSLDLQKALTHLPDLERASLILCDAAGFTHAEAASVLDTPLGSVKTYIARAREKMRALLDGPKPIQERPCPDQKNSPNTNGAFHAA